MEKIVSWNVEQNPEMELKKLSFGRLYFDGMDSGTCDMAKYVISDFGPLLLHKSFSFSHLIMRFQKEEYCAAYLVLPVVSYLSLFITHQG
jgi:hypothetical protein